jgi:DegV family protein with EDD domain
MVSILTDSTSDLGKEIASEFGLGVIPLTVTLGGKSYKDGVDIFQENLFRLVAETGELPKTAAPSVGEFGNFFDRTGENIFVGISSQLSATIQNATLAAQSNTNTQVVDSLSLSTGVGLLALLAANLRDEGLSVSEIYARLLDARAKLRVSFMIDTMDYLYKGGRCTALQAIAGSMLNIHPIIEVRPDGTLGVKEKTRGVRQKGLQMLLDDFAARLNELDRHRVFVTHTACPEDAEFLKNEIVRIAAPDDVRVTLAGSVVSSHCGPGTIGILYFVK